MQTSIKMKKLNGKKENVINFVPDDGRKSNNEEIRNAVKEIVPVIVGIVAGFALISACMYSHSEPVSQKELKS